MRRPLAGLMLVSSVLAGCGSDGGGGAGVDPTTPAPEPVTLRAACAELYHPPAQLMPRAIELVHGSPSAEGPAGAEELVSALADAAGRAPASLAADLAVVRTSVDARRTAEESGSGGPDLEAFDAASSRLAGHCKRFND
ncbi:hypothetical protein [Nocardioides sp. T2.26MG-1]|uniref:hypothetical protein n=1 Tax=Nocardioides sp. T2.26MG-1 TaxID=3041166 RepID=UPI0025414069|nr:hypothetical protein [Nocardioides sp. T2.26MG-1]